jgi:hypothetical protein
MTPFIMFLVVDIQVKIMADKCKAPLGSSAGFGQFLLTCIRSCISMAGSEFHSFCGL